MSQRTANVIVLYSTVAIDFHSCLACLENLQGEPELLVPFSTPVFLETGFG